MMEEEDIEKILGKREENVVRVFPQYVIGARNRRLLTRRRRRRRRVRTPRRLWVGRRSFELEVREKFSCVRCVVGLIGFLSRLIRERPHTQTHERARQGGDRLASDSVCVCVCVGTLAEVIISLSPLASYPINTHILFSFISPSTYNITHIYFLKYFWFIFL